MSQFNTVTLLKKSVAALTTMKGRFCQNAFSDGPVLPDALQREIAVLIDNLKEHYGQLERSGENEKRHPAGGQRAERSDKGHTRRSEKHKDSRRLPKGMGKGGVPLTEDAVKEMDKAAKATTFPLSGGGSGPKADEGLMI